MGRLTLTVVAVAAAGGAQAACPQNVVDCMGAAAGFAVVAEKLSINKGITGSEGFSGAQPAFVGDVCAPKAAVGGPAGCETTVDSLVLLAADGFAASFNSSASYCSSFTPGIGVIVSGDVVTGGGLLRRQAVASLLGNVDTTGTDPRLPACAQAMADVQSASATLGALAPTRDLGAIRVAPSDGLLLVADPGVNVWTASQINLLSRTAPFGEISYSTLRIQLDPATESVVINVAGNVNIGTFSDIDVMGEAAADRAKVVLNLTGSGALRTRGIVWFRVLAARGTVTVKPNPEGSGVSGGAYARRIGVFGGGISNN
jgi:choice-of-anchor A domain-containing protein